nr:hypothetical protein [Candidatus Doudnabacteria bacterium]
MSEPKFELPKNLTPHGDNNDREIEEIVSPVQPPKGPHHVKSGLVPFLIVLICALIGGAALYDRWPKFEYRIKEAKAPESETQPIPTPSVVVALTVSPTPTPQISSISTDEPSIVVAPTPTAVPTPVAIQPTPKPTVAGASSVAASTKATTYTSPYGYSVRLQSGASISAEGAIAAVYNTRGDVTLRIEVAELLLETSSTLGHQLALGSDVTNLKAVVIDGYAGYSYRISGRNALALIKGSTVY